MKRLIIGMSVLVLSLNIASLPAQASMDAESEDIKIYGGGAIYKQKANIDGRANIDIVSKKSIDDKDKLSKARLREESIGDRDKLSKARLREESIGDRDKLSKAGLRDESIGDKDKLSKAGLSDKSIGHKKVEVKEEDANETSQDNNIEEADKTKPTKNDWIVLDGGQKKRTDDNGEIIVNSFFEVDGGRYYSGNDGIVKAGGFFEVGDKLYWAKADGVLAKDGWIEFESKKYYAGSNAVIIRNDWIILGTKKYRALETGEIATNTFIMEGGQRYWIRKDGDLLKGGWLYYENHWYYLSKSGAMVSGDWVYYRDKWYYMTKSGAMVSGDWVYYKNKWYYMTKSGAMVSGDWVYYRDKWYYMTKSGAMVSGDWVYYKNKWYWLRGGGEMSENSWIKVKDEYYWTKKGGELATNEWVRISGKSYWFDNSGLYYDWKSYARLPVHTRSQLSPYWLPNGCEITSELMAIEYKGVKGINQLTLVNSIDYSDNPNYGFTGNMRSSKDYNGTTPAVWPKAIIKQVKKYRPDSADISGASMSRLQRELMNGNPVMVWFHWGDPVWVNSSRGWYKSSSKLHCVLLTGFDDDKFFINDPWGGRKYTRNKWYFYKMFASYGKKAVAIR